MKKSVKSAAERILDLRSTYSETDLMDAIRILSNSENWARFQRTEQTQSKKSTSDRLAKKPKKEPDLSKVVADLRGVDHEKFEMLSRFDSAFRQGEVLRTLDMVRDIGASIDKSFDPGKSRKGAISKFMKLLASLPTSEARDKINYILESERNAYDSAEAYSQLAEYIIGKSE
ncbi:hypothetical protein ABC977_17780 [Thioalkalicoccus limnaeus]|uniref:DUF3486 domain-containing protein n=1 Tax=Thioalkalicoccus limnaeus TaxID=120681 RepID=A0ABV4BP31_9GAMM